MNRLQLQFNINVTGSYMVEVYFHNKRQMRFPDPMRSYGSAKYHQVRKDHDRQPSCKYVKAILNWPQIIPGLGANTNVSKTFIAGLGISKTKVTALNVPDQPCQEDKDGTPDVSACIAKHVEERVGCGTLMVGSEDKKSGDKLF